MSCPHVASLPDLPAPAREKFFKPTCESCGPKKSPGETWLCLYCHRMGCGRLDRSHAAQHAETHPLAMNMRTTAVWCFQCKHEVNDVGENIREIFLQKKNSKKHPKVGRIVGPSPVGILNVGNTCFAAAALQCLRHTLPFERCLRMCPPFSEAELERPSGSRRLVLALRKIFLDGVDTGAVIDPSELVEALQRVNALFQGYHQQDSQEFLRFLLSTVHDEVGVDWKKGKEHPSVLSPSSVVSDVFCGVSESTVTCLTCSKNSVTKELFFDLSLPVVSGEEPGAGVLARFSRFIGLQTVPSVSLQECLTAFLDEETLAGADAYMCETCKVKTESLKKIRIKQWPETLVVHLKRFRPGGYKLPQAVTFPVDEVFCVDEDTSYSTFALVEHLGSNSNGGHYVAYCKEGQSWNRFDDSRVTTGISPDQVRANVQPYILFLKRAGIGCTPDGEIGGGKKSNSSSIVPLRWICQRDTMDGPPRPILTAENVCPHGHPSTVCPEHAKTIFKSVAPEDVSHVPFIGPHVKSVVPCTECSAVVKHYNTRLAIEHKLITKLDTKALSENEQWHFIDAAWVSRWRQYLRKGPIADINKACSPGAVSNDVLAEKLKKHKDKVKINSDYIAVNRNVWLVFLHCHGDLLEALAVTCASLDAMHAHVHPEPKIHETEIDALLSLAGLTRAEWDSITWCPGAPDTQMAADE